MNAANPRSIHKNLIVRISVAGFIISFLFGFAAWEYGKKDIRRQIRLRAVDGFKILNNQIRDLFDNPKALNPSGIQHALDRIMSLRRNIQLGQIIWVGIYDLNGNRIAQFRDDTYEHIEQVEKLADKLPAGPTIHDFRRSACRNMIRSGVPQQVAKMVSRHKTDSIFNRYNIVTAEDLKLAAKKQEAYLQSQKDTISSTIHQMGTKKEATPNG